MSEGKDTLELISTIWFTCCKVETARYCSVTWAGSGAQAIDQTGPPAKHTGTPEIRNRYFVSFKQNTYGYNQLQNYYKPFITSDWNNLNWEYGVLSKHTFIDFWCAGMYFSICDDGTVSHSFVFTFMWTCKGVEENNFKRLKNIFNHRHSYFSNVLLGKKSKKN